MRDTLLVFRRGRRGRRRVHLPAEEKKDERWEGEGYSSQGTVERGEWGEEREERLHCRLTLLMNSHYVLYFKHIEFFLVYYVHLIYPIDR